MAPYHRVLKEMTDIYKRYNNENDIVGEINLLLARDDINEVYRHFGIKAGGFLYANVLDGSTAFFQDVVNSFSDITYSIPYRFDLSFEEGQKEIIEDVIHKLFVYHRVQQNSNENALKNLIRGDDYYRWLHQNIPTLDCRYCKVGELLFFIYCWRLLSIKCKKGLVKDLELSRDYEFNKSFYWLAENGSKIDNEFRIGEKSIHEMIQNFVLIFNNLGEASIEDKITWGEELILIGVIDESGSYDLKLKEYISKFNNEIEINSESKLQQICFEILREKFNIDVSDNQPVDDNALLRLASTSPFPILPYYFWNLLEPKKVTYLVYPVWHSVIDKVKHIKGATNEHIETHITGFALCAVSPIDELEELNDDLLIIPKVAETLRFLKLISLPLVEVSYYNQFIKAWRNNRFDDLMREIHHSNFRGLYWLEPEVYSTLQASVKCFPNETLPKELNEDGKKLADLLRIIPKTDLHIHIGSCMSERFLCLSSIVSLTRYNWDEFNEKLYESSDTLRTLCRSDDPITIQLPPFLRLQKGQLERIQEALAKILLFDFTEEESTIEIKLSEDKEPFWLNAFGTMFRVLIEEGYFDNHSKERAFRSALHKYLGIPDYINLDELKVRVSNYSFFELGYFLFSVTEQINGNSKIGEDIPKDDFIRILILSLANKKKAEINIEGQNILALFGFTLEENKNLKNIWNNLHSLFYEDKGVYSINSFRARGWKMPKENKELDSFTVKNLSLLPTDIWLRPPSYKDNPLSWILATGARKETTNLKEYLEGCEYSGAEHLRHPFPMNYLAYEIVGYFISMGVVYSELRCSPSGYQNLKSNFEFEQQEVNYALKMAFGQAQAFFASSLQNQVETAPQLINEILKSIFSTYESNSFLQHEKFMPLPCKIGLLFVGKRHKPIREMILEAAAAASMISGRRKKEDTELHFSKLNSRTEKESLQIADKEVIDFFKNCEVVGFDLAGQEVDNPPEKFASEYSRLSKLHIPLTIHAGENANSEFVENAILSLNARRIGHGLSLQDDQWLMNRVREEKVCIELCPISNTQTSSFVLPNDRLGRQYPLKKFMENGLLVTLSTDNPIISNTNIIMEYLMASHYYDTEGMKMWDILKIIRFGFVSAFMSQTDRRSMLYLVEERLQRILKKEEVRKFLNEVHKKRTNA